MNEIWEYHKVRPLPQSHISSLSGPPSALLLHIIYVLRKRRRQSERGTEWIFQFSYLHELFACGTAIETVKEKENKEKCYFFEKKGKNRKEITDIEWK